MPKFFASLLVAAAVLLIGGCAAKPTVTQGDIDALTREIKRLGPDVAPEEAERAASIAYLYSLQLAREYEITDPPIIHNDKVLHGLRERGLCNDWTEDLLKRLNQENFRTLSLHWATSPPATFRIIHHTAVISRRGDTLYDGIILDPWRYGGTLYWSRPQADRRYDWRPRLEVRENQIRIQEAEAAAAVG
ncbi:hypothetical protein [Defluviimonas salinarum]|uniref:Lipoprotein n=1 Tax=Defluviimonas salinarum TaxID=2992147 RepID=A0ABT3IZN6_9RHOB|nr:hypothetical protein [Defluviimonas salinarum]MCW3780892.1 hypothetical protein [Defluviimonas salinarum]